MGALERSDPQLARLRRLADERGDRAQVVAVDALVAMADLARGETGPARRWAATLTAVDDLPPAAQQRLNGLARALQANADATEGDVAGWLRGTADVVQRALTHGSGMLPAQAAVRRAAGLLALGDAGIALRVVLPAALALDAIRCALSDAGRRRWWAAMVSNGFDVAARTAAARGETSLLAKLLDVARGNAMPRATPGAAGDPMTVSLGALLDDAAPPHPAGGIPGPALVAGDAGRTVLVQRRVNPSGV